MYKKAEVVSNEEVEFGKGAIAFQVDRELFNSFKNVMNWLKLNIEFWNVGIGNQIIKFTTLHSN